MQRFSPVIESLVALPYSAGLRWTSVWKFFAQLGDGRALLLGEIIDRAGKRQDVQLKGVVGHRFHVVAMGCNWTRASRISCKRGHARP